MVTTTYKIRLKFSFKNDGGQHELPAQWILKLEVLKSGHAGKLVVLI